MIRTGAAALAGAAGLALLTGCGKAVGTSAGAAQTSSAAAAPSGAPVISLSAGATSAVSAAVSSSAGATDGTEDGPVPTFPPITTTAQPTFIPDTSMASNEHDFIVSGVEGGPNGYALLGYQGLMTCGPGIPDDCELNDASNAQVVRIEPNAEVTLLGNLPEDSYQSSVPTLVSMLHFFMASSWKGQPYHALGWYGGGFVITIDSAGEISKLMELYHP